MATPLVRRIRPVTLRISPGSPGSPGRKNGIALAGALCWPPRLLRASRIAMLTAGLVLLFAALLGSLEAQAGNPAGNPTGAQAAPANRNQTARPLTGQLNPPAALQFAAAPAPVAPAEPPPVVHLARIKDIASIEGIRDNQLVGYGIVVGLHGTGDSQQTSFPIQTLAATLLRMGVSVPAASIKVQNLAAVFISATLPPFSRPGTKIDITAASAGDAQSLEGGLLLMTPLYGPDGKIYAQAEGPLVVGGYTVSLNGNTRQMNHPTTARIPGGGDVERGLSLDISARKNFSILLDEEDFRSAEAMAHAINRELERPAAHALDSRRIDLEIAPGEDVPTLLARVEAIEVPFYPRAKVIVNERTGTVVIGGTVVLQPVSILHGGLAINVVSDFEVSQPNAFSGGTTQVVQQSRVEARDKPVNRIELRQGATVDDLVRSLQAIGATARDVISILQAMKAAGALEAEIEVL
ncbi:MAG TPA: flagellar basal body P-ring protein FlgI [Granulicella sp.]|jgi:flagellar P-ring protein precursor FlgI|nr:flagellar basal body P-ring protein FlgI [Granulicella sp.]